MADDEFRNLSFNFVEVGFADFGDGGTAGETKR